MAYVNVKDWSVEQVTEWLKGLDVVLAQYTKSFLNNGVKGHQLLSLRSDDLEHLGVVILGHQEIILEAVEHLRNFHYMLDKENLQTLALRLSCAANSLYKELLLTDENCTMVPTQIMSDVHNIISSIKPLVCWLDRSPFRGEKDYIDCKLQLLQLSFEMATHAHRDIFSEKPLRTIRNISSSLAQLADHIIQVMSDPMILQPASLALATLKKKEQELGFFLMPSNHAIHQIVEIKYGSPAHNSSKIEEGDEIVQVNYQTVVGWQRKNVLLLLQESPPEIVLTLKKRPRHTKVYGQIYMKPYRLPSKKRATPYSRWNDNLPSPQLLAIHDLPQIPPPRLPPVEAPPEIETETSSSSDSEPLDSPLDGGRVYPLKPRPVLQRRNTITGASPTSKRPHQAIEQYWQQLKNQAASKHSSSYTIQSNKYSDETTLLRDKSASCTLDLVQRPTTILGITHSKHPNANFTKQLQDKSLKKKKVNFDDKNTFLDSFTKSQKPEKEIHETNLNEEHSISVNSLSSLKETIDFIDEGEDITDRSSMKSDWQKQIVEEIIDTISVEKPQNVIERDAALADVHVYNIIKKFDEKRVDVNVWDQKNVKPKVLPKNLVEKPPELPQKPDFTKKPVVPPKNLKTKIRGPLNKSHSTPAYDQTESPEFAPEKQKSLQTIKDPEPPLLLDNAPIKYELGIPIVENNNLYAVTEHDISLHLSTENIMERKEFHDIPPKPPPRMPYSVDSSKRNYESSRRLASECQNYDASKDYLPYSVTSSHSASLRSVNDTNSNYSYAQKDYAGSVDSLIIPKSTENLFQEQKPLGKKIESVDKLDSTFEPKGVSTPVAKQCKIEFPEVDFTYSKSPASLDIMRVASDNKISPTNSIVRAMMYSTKSKAEKKKNTLIAKRRKVSVKDVAPGELQSYLYKRARSKQGQPAHWDKRWFVLNGTCLYGFESKDSLKAKCVIFLSGFTVSVATEVKSRNHAFKVYHTGTVFYFSAENSEMLSSWIELIAAATLLYNSSKSGDASLYSESDDSDGEKNKSGLDKPVDSMKKFGSLKKSGNKSNASAQSGSSSLDRKWFFNKSNSIYKNSLPVPTEQFRSYRKISNSINMMGSISTGNFTSHIPDFSTRFEAQAEKSQSISTTRDINETPKKPDVEASKPKIKKPNYIHASNPNLCDISDFHLRTFHKIQPFQQCSDNLAGFVTLEELMNRQSEEQKLNPHVFNDAVAVNPQFIRADVVYGEVPIRPIKEEKEKEKKKKSSHSRTVSDCSEQISSSGSSRKTSQTDDELNNSKHSNESTFCFGKRGSLKKQKKEKEAKDCYAACTYPKAKGHEEKLNRSLPRTQRLDTQEAKSKKHHRNGDKKLFIGKEYSVSYVDLKDHSSEMVYCPQTSKDVHFAQNRSLESTKKGKIVRQHSLTSVDKKEVKRESYSNSTERLWIDSLRRSDKVSDKNSSSVKLKSAIQYTPMSLPLVPDQKGKLNPKFAFELNLDEKSSKTGMLKNFFGKQSDGKKEKSFLGSPKLHRAVFEKHTPSNLSPIAWPPDPSQVHIQRTLDSCYYTLDDPSSTKNDSIPPLNTTPTIDYPGLEYPPVFEPETYSLADPQTSITLLRKDKNY